MEYCFYVYQMEKERNQLARNLKKFETEHQKYKGRSKEIEESFRALEDQFKEDVAKRDRDIDKTLGTFQMVDDDTKRKILLLRSRYDLPFEDIGEKVGYCETHCKRLLKAALLELEQKGIKYQRKGKRFADYFPYENRRYTESPESFTGDISTL